MKKICYVVTIPGTIRAFFIPQLKYLEKNGYEVFVICSDDGKIKEDLGDKIKYIPVDIPRGISFVGSIKAINELESIFKKEKFDLIQYSTANAALYASIAAKRVGCKVRNHHVMGFRFLGLKGIRKIIMKTIEKISCDNSTSIECVSKSNMELGIAEKIFSKNNVTVVWNGSTGGVDCERFDYRKREQWRREIREELGYSEYDFVYGFVGRITRDKGINEILEAYLSLNTDAKLILIGYLEGENTLRIDLLEQARKCSNIQFHDAVTDIERYYAAMDVLLLPSYREGFGNVTIEAGAVGTPAIVSNIPGPIDTIDKGKTALLVEAKNTTDLARKMKQIRECDYEAMGRDAAKFAKEKFDSQILCQKILIRKEELMGL